MNFLLEYKLPLLAIFIILNLISFITYGVDKHKAVKNKWRIPESTLILLALIGGAVGAILGMKVFRHKTKHPKFYIGVPLILVLHIVIVALFIYLTW